MAEIDKIRADVLKALGDWNAGRAVRSLELGHTQRQVDTPGASPRILQDRHFRQDQDRAHAYCFHILAHFALHGAPESHEVFTHVCDQLEQEFRAGNEGLTAEELDGAESLAWKALAVGWRRAIDGYKDVQYIEVTKPEAK